MIPREVEGFKCQLHGERFGSICQIVEAVTDIRVLDDAGPTFIVRFTDGALKVMPGDLLSPWFAV